MRTIVNTTKQTTYVVTDRDIIEALVGLGIPRSVLLSADATIKLDWPTMDLYKDGFYFEDADDDTFLTVEGPVEDVKPEPAPEPVKEEVYPNGTVLTGLYTGYKYTVMGYDGENDRYQIRRADGTIFYEATKLLKRDYTPEPAPAPTRLPIGSVVTFKKHNGTEELCYIVGYRNDCAGYIMWNVTNKREVWDRHSDVVKVGGQYTVVYTPDPNRNTKPFDGAFPLGTVFKHKSGVTLIVNGYHAGPSKAYNCYIDRYKAGQEHHSYLTNADVYTVLYTPSERSKT